MIPQSDGLYRIRSVASPTLYVTQTPSILQLASHSTNNTQLWHIGYIWHIVNDGHQQSWFGFWDGVINIRTQAIPTNQAAGFNFETRMATARNAWRIALGVTFHTVTDHDESDPPQIRAYGGCRIQISSRINDGVRFSTSHERYGAMIFEGRSGGDVPGPVGNVRAGGESRVVRKLNDIAEDGVIRMAVFSNSGFGTLDSRNITFATMATIHELGHALGYFGHSPHPDDVMRGSIPLSMTTPNERLNPAEIEHLRQLYRRRPW